MRIGSALLCVLALFVTGGPALGDDAAQAAKTTTGLTDAEKEHFLLESQLVDRGHSAGGTTRSRRVTLSLDGFEHDAHVQTIDVQKDFEKLRTGPVFDFRDSYRNNIAAYRLDRMLGLQMVPVTVYRHYDAKPAAFTWWVDDVVMDLQEQTKKKARPPNPVRWNCQIFSMRAFDELIFNFDRNQGNLLIDKDWWVWMIDHSRAFKLSEDLKEETLLGPICERRFLAALKELDKPTLETAMEDMLDEGQIEGLLKRRDKIVAHYEARIERLGEGVLCDLHPQPAEPAEPESP